MVFNNGYKSVLFIFFGSCICVSCATESHGCAKPEKFEESYYIPNKGRYEVDDEIAYSCYYVPALYKGSKTRRCLQDGTWSGDLFYCGCSDPAFPIGGGEFSPKRLFHRIGEIVQYKCYSDKSHLFGNLTRTCLGTGTWSGPLPYCVSQSSVQLFNFKRGQEVLIDKKTSTCLRNNDHDQIFLLIKGKHRNFVVQILSNKNENKTSDVYNENSHSYKRLTHEFSKLEDGGLFMHQYTYKGTESLSNTILGIGINSCSANSDCKTCEVIVFTDKISSCHWLHKPDNHTFITYDKKTSGSQTYFDYGTAATFSCGKGYTLEGNKTRYCEENDTWTGNSTFCRVSSCPRLNKPNNHTFISYDKKPPSSQVSFDYGTSATFSCIKGYTLEGNKTWYCEENDRWRGNETFCRAVKCKRQPPELNNAFWSKWENGMAYSINHTLVAVCNHGYVNYGQSMTVTCTSEETWSPQLIEDNCQKIECAMPTQIIENSNWAVNGTAESFKVGATLEIICKQGYWGNDTHFNITCLSTGNWSLSEAECLVISEPIYRSRRTEIISLAAVGLILVCLCLGFCIFWTRRRIKRKLQKKVKQTELLLENPIYNSTSSDQQEEECKTVVLLKNPTYDNSLYDQQEEDCQKMISLKNPIYKSSSSDQQKDNQIDNPIYSSTSSDLQEENGQKRISLENPIYKSPSPDQQKDHQMDNPIYNSVSSAGTSSRTLPVENPIYKSASSGHQKEERSAVCFQTQKPVSDLTKHPTPFLTEIPTAETINKLYLSECPIAKPIHEYNSDNETINASEKIMKCLPKSQPEMEVMVDNEIYE